MRRLPVILLVAAFLLGGVAYATYAVHAARTPQFTLRVTPSVQMIFRGGTMSVAVDLSRSDAFRGPVRLRTIGLPPRVTAHWQRSDGGRAPLLTRGQNGAVLTLRATTRAPLATRRVTIRATGGGHTAQRTMLLTVARPSQRRFKLVVTPPRRFVAPGATARYMVHVHRARGFRGRVRLRMLRVPAGARARIRIGALAVTASRARRTASYRLVVEGTSTAHGRILRRYAVLTLSVVVPVRFAVGGDLTAALFPGVGAPLDLTFSNPNHSEVRVDRLDVAVRADTTHPGCDGHANYSVAQYTGDYPLLLPPGSSSLSGLAPDASRWPQIAMRNLPTNQDACKGAVVTLDYTGQTGP